LALTRFTAAGALDPSFGKKGAVFDAGQPGWGQVVDVFAQGQKIAAVGWANREGRYHYVLRRFTAAGALDLSFGQNGRVSTLTNAPALAAFVDTAELLVAGAGDPDAPDSSSLVINSGSAHDHEPALSVCGTRGCVPCYRFRCRLIALVLGILLRLLAGAERVVRLEWFGLVALLAVVVVDVLRRESKSCSDCSEILGGAVALADFAILVGGAIGWFVGIALASVIDQAR
jgi:Domain of unknown function (DUF5122) beta-propeller